MNQMDENYWKEVAANWIQLQQRNSVHHPQSQIEIPNVPEAPKITNFNYQQNHITKHHDNLAVADMDIEDVKDEEEPVQQSWNNLSVPWQNSNIQQQSQLHPIQHTSNNPSRFSKQEIKKSSIPQQHQLVIPDPPIIEEQLNSIDMDMDDSDNDDSNSNSASSAGMMDMKKRKVLPIWIREGLEKMKREKELENARLQEELKLKEDEENRKILMEEALKEIESEKISKSKYDSSASENEEDKPLTTPKTELKLQATSESIEDDEDAYEKMMLLVRKTLTSILLEVTNEKIQEISTEMHTKFRKKATATTVNKPAILGLGLGAYSSSSDEDDSGDDEKDGGDYSDWEPESALKERIRQKTIAFEKRAKDIKEKLAKITEVEEERFRRRSSQKSESESVKNAKLKHNNSDSDNDRQKYKNFRKDGEEKYEQIIYSISASSAISSTRVLKEKKTRFSDLKEGRSTSHMTHVGMIDSRTNDNGSTSSSNSNIIVPPPPPSSLLVDVDRSVKEKLKEKKKKRHNSSSSTSSSDSTRRKKHKKNKKSSKHSKKSSKKRDKSKSRSKSREKRHHKSDRHSMESTKSSIRSSDSRRRSRSRSRSRDRHRRRY